MATTVGTIQVVASINTKDYDAGKRSIEKGNKELESGAKKTSSGFSAAWIGAVAGVAASLTNTFVGAVKSSIGSAVKRVDTLNNSARTFANMGIDAEVSAKSMAALEKSIKGLPTPLDSAVRGMTGLTATYGDIDKGQKVFSALNNAILGFGGSADMVDNAITQLSQLPMDGPLDAQTWNSLRNSGITPVLTAMAKDSGMSVAKMKKAFGDGELTVKDFTDRLLKLNSEGGGGLVSLEKIAKDSTKGIGTGFANMQTAITRGVAGIIQEIGSENISNAITKVGDTFTVVLGLVAKSIGWAIDAIKRFKNTEVAVTIMERLADAIDVVRNSLKNIPKLAGDLASLVETLTKQFKGLPTVLQVLISPLGAIINNFKELWGIIQSWFMPSIKALWGTIKNQLAPIFSTLIDVVVRLYNALQPALVNILKVIGLIIGVVVVGAVWLFINVLNIVLKVIGFVINIILDLIGWVTNLIKWIGNVGGVFKSAFNIALSAVTSVFNWVKNNWGKILQLLTWPIGSAVNIIKTSLNTIKSVISTVVGWFRSIPNGIKSGLSTVGGIITSPFKSAFNGVAKMWNNTIGKISFKAPDWVPGMGGKGFSVPKIPMLAQGGITTGPTLAMIGEGREQEAVLPLSKLEGLLDRNETPEVKQNTQVVVSLKHSKGAMRQAALDTIDLVNEVYRAKGIPQIGVQL